MEERWNIFLFCIVGNPCSLCNRAQRSVSLSVRHSCSHGGNTGKECSDHAAALGALGLVSSLHNVERWPTPRLNTTALLSSNIDLPDVELHLRNAPLERVPPQQTRAARWLYEHDLVPLLPPDYHLPFHFRFVPQPPSHFAPRIACREWSLVCAPAAANLVVSRTPGLLSGPFLPWQPRQSHQHVRLGPLSLTCAMSGTRNTIASR